MKAIRNSFCFSSPFSGALRTLCSLKILSSIIICACYFFLKRKCLHFENIRNCDDFTRYAEQKILRIYVAMPGHLKFELVLILLIVP